MNTSSNPSPVTSIFETHFSNCYKLLYNSSIPLTQKINLELYSVLYVVSDLAAFSEGHNRKAISDMILRTIFNKLSLVYRELPTDALFKRIDFYTSVVGGLDLHAHAFMGKDVSDANPVFRCAIAFSDCCLNPGYLDNYNGPSLSINAIDVFDFTTSVLEPFNAELTALYNEIYDYSRLSAHQFSAAHQPVATPRAATSSQVPPVVPKKSRISRPLIFLVVFILCCAAFVAYAWSNVDTTAFNATEPPEITLPIHSLPVHSLPVNGRVLQHFNEEGVAPFTVTTPSGSHYYYFILRSVSDPTVKMRFFLFSNSSGDYTVPLGEYELYYACGTTWYGVHNLFGPDTLYYRCDTIFSFEQNADGYAGWTVELEPISNGNLDTDLVDAEDFPK